MSRRKRYQPPVKKNSTFTLNITSLTDMFTIMLVFLLQTFSSSEVELSPVEGLRLPSSNSDANPVLGIKLSISKESLRIDDKILAAVKDLDFEAKEVDSKDRNFIPSLFNELQTLTKDSTKAHVKEGRILLQADESLPYQTIRRVMYTASMAGFPQLKLVTVAGE